MKFTTKIFSLLPFYLIVIVLLSANNIFAQTAYQNCLNSIASNFGENPENCEYLRNVQDEPTANPAQNPGEPRTSPVQNPGEPRTSPVQNPGEPTTSPVQTDSPPVSISLNNPLEGIGSIEGLVKTLLNVLIVLAVPIVVFFIILAGFKYVTARGEPAKLEEAKRSLVYAIIGGVIIVGATAIFEIIVNTVNSFRG